MASRELEAKREGNRRFGKYATPSDVEFLEWPAAIACDFSALLAEVAKRGRVDDGAL